MTQSVFYLAQGLDSLGIKFVKKAINYKLKFTIF